MDGQGKENQMGHEKRRNNEAGIIPAVIGLEKNLVTMMWC